MILDKYKPDQVLVTAGPGLNPINLGYGRAVAGFQLYVVILDSGSVKEELLVTTGSVSRRVAHSDPDVNTAIPDPYLEISIRHRTAVYV